MRKQKSVSEPGFDRYDWSRLQKRIDQVEDKRTYIRLHAVQMVATGKAISEVAAFMGITPHAIYSRILKALKDNPMQLGYNVNTWTVDTLARRLRSLYCPVTPTLFIEE